MCGMVYVSFFSNIKEREYAMIYLVIYVVVDSKMMTQSHLAFY